MKTKFLLLLSGLITLTGCFYYAPSTVKYQGKRYKTNWCESAPSNGREYYPCIKHDETKEIIFQKARYNFWSTDEYEFDILYAEFEDSQFWRPHVYIATDELKEAQAYYQDKQNFNYHIGIWLDDEKDISISDNNELEVLDTFIDHIMEAKKTSKTIKVYEEYVGDIRPTCWRTSKDGLFMTYKEELHVFNDTIYDIKKYDAKEKCYILYDLGEAGKTLYSIFQKYNLIA